MTTWNFSTKNTTNYSGDTKHSTSYSNQSISLTDSFVLMENSYRLLLENLSNIILEQSIPSKTNYGFVVKN